MKRPVIFTGIGDVIERSDLKDRTLTLHLPPVSPESRKTEEEIWRVFANHHPGILAALLDCVCQGIAGFKRVNPLSLPRMADWYKFMLAAYPVMGFPDGLLEEVLEEDKQDAANGAIEGSCLAQALIDFMKTKLDTDGTATDWWRRLRQVIEDEWPRFDARRFPADARQLSKELRRLQPDLMRVGIEVSFDRHPTRRLILIRRRPEVPRAATVNDDATSGNRHSSVTTQAVTPKVDSAPDDE